MNRNISKNIIRVLRSTSNKRQNSEKMRKSNDFKLDLYQYSYSSSLHSQNAQIDTNSRSYSFATKKTRDSNMTNNQNNSNNVCKMDEEGQVVNNDMLYSQKQQKGQQLVSNSTIGKREKLSRMKVQLKRPIAINTLQTILSWRKLHQAPVDIVGCQRLHDLNQPLEIQKYQTLIALILSVQTKDQTTGKVMQRLKTYGLNPTKISQTEENKLIELIHESNFNKKKAKNIIQISKLILKDGLPKSMEDLVKYPGVGVKIATIYLRTAEGVNEGIGVDTHVHRISERLGWTYKAKNPNETEKQLQQLFPKEYWNQINVGMVGFGQILCDAKKPKCELCPISKQCEFKSLYLQF